MGEHAARERDVMADFVESVRHGWFLGCAAMVDTAMTGGCERTIRWTSQREQTRQQFEGFA